MDKVIEQVILRSTDRLQFEKGSPCTIDGYDALKIEISSYINELVEESYRVARRHKSDLISKSHIESASFNLIKKYSSNAKKYLMSIGGFLLGFSIAKTVEIVADSQNFTTTNILILFSCAIIGAFISGISLLKT